MNEPTIEVKFGTCAQTNEQIRSIYVKCFKEAIAAARGDKAALEELNRLAKEAVWMTDSLIYEVSREV